MFYIKFRAMINDIKIYEKYVFSFIQADFINIFFFITYTFYIFETLLLKTCIYLSNQN